MPELLAILVLTIFLSSCAEKEESANHSTPESQVEQCPQRDSLVAEIAAFRSMVADPTQSSQCEEKMRTIVSLMDHHTGPGTTCRYLDIPMQEDGDHFSFVQDLTDWSIRDTLLPGIYFILKLRGDFSENNQVYELFSTHLGQIASQNPICYDRYLRKTPGQMSMLLNTTKWNHDQIPAIKAGFEEVDAVPGILEFLDEIKPS